MDDEPTASEPPADDHPALATWLGEAVRLAVANAEAGAAPFAALVVVDGEVVGTGVNTVDADDDPTAHAEVAAVRAASRALGSTALRGSVVASSCEPCAMCHLACLVAGVGRIVYAAPKELVPDDGSDPRPDLVAMQAAVRALAPTTVSHLPTPDAGRPFARWREMTGSRP